MSVRKATVLIGLAIIIVAVNWQIAAKERVLKEGATILLQLAPKDPRSLMQGDYMALDYAIARQIGGEHWPNDGAIVVAAEGDGVSYFVRRYEPGSALAAGEHLLRYRTRDGRIRIGTDAFYFQEGLADAYVTARYGELRVDAQGEGLLIGLRDGERRKLPLEKPADAQR